MEFNEFNAKVKLQFEKMSSSGMLFKSNISGSKVWETYLNSFKPENNNIFRDPESSEHNCNCCHNFIRRYGNIISVNAQGNLESIFSNIDNVGEYTDSVKACATLLETGGILSVFFETYHELDKNLNYEKVNKQKAFFQLGQEPLSSYKSKSVRSPLILFGLSALIPSISDSHPFLTLSPDVST